LKFKLLIECTKDIDELSINFTDGTSVVKESKTTKPTEPTEEEHTHVHHETPNDNLTVHEPDNNWFEETPDADSTKVTLPKIEPAVREDVKIAQELQNLDI